MNLVYYTYADSPVGKLLIAGNQTALHCVSFSSGKTVRVPDLSWIEDQQPLQAVLKQLQAYFKGQLREFKLPLALAGTPFQQQVWNALKDIPYGKTLAYGELARKIGNPKASRAVGGANAKNPIAIVIPCHRVIGSGGDLVGFGGGLSIKETLLKLEAENLQH